LYSMIVFSKFMSTLVIILGISESSDLVPDVVVSLDISFK
jgi:hypothetical protein